MLIWGSVGRTELAEEPDQRAVVLIAQLAHVSRGLATPRRARLAAEPFEQPPRHAGRPPWSLGQSTMGGWWWRGQTGEASGLFREC